MYQKIDLLPRLKDILNANYDPNGGYVAGSPDTTQLVMAPWSETNVCLGTVSLNAPDYEAYQDLRQKVRAKEPKIPVIDLGGGGAMVGLADLAATIDKAGKDIEAIAQVDVTPE